MNPLDDAINAALLGGGHKGHPGHGGHNGGGPVDPIPTVLPDPIIYDRASHTGHTALYTVFVIMLIATALFGLLGFRLPASKRLYHVITTTIVATAAVSYFAMASSAHWPLHCNHHGSYSDSNKLNSFSFYPGTSTLVSGSSGHDGEKPHWECRQVLWPRYADWAITTPLLLLDLCLLAGIDGAATTVAILADLAMVLTGLFAALAAREGVRWAWYAMACVAYLVIIYAVGVGGLRKQKATRTQSGVAKVWSFLAIWTLVIWTLYPIIWGFAEGANKMNVDKEIIAYAILDILAKPVFGLVLLVAHSRIPETNVDVGGWWAHGLSSTGRIRIGDDEDA